MPNNVTHIFFRVIACVMIFVSPAIGFSKYVPGNERTFPLLCNGVPCAIDSINHIIYCSVKPATGDSVKVVFSSSELDSLSFDFSYIKTGDSVSVANKFTRKHYVYIKETATNWSMYFSSLPIVLLDATELETDTQHSGFITIIDPLCRTESGNNLFIHYSGVKIRGASASSYPKKSYAVELWDDNDEETDASILGMRSDDDIILDAMYIDKARMRNRVCFDFWNKIDSIPYAEEDETKLNGTEGTFVEVLVNGLYNGLYCLTDKIDRKKLHLKKYKTDPDTGEVAQHGVLYKARSWSSATRFNGYDTEASTNTLSWCGWEQKYPDDNDSLANWEPLIKLLNFSTPEFNSNTSLFSALLTRRFYEQNLINYVLFLNLFHVYDNNCKNTYVSFVDCQKTPLQALFTPWDMDASLGRNWNGNALNSYGFDQVVTNCGLFKRLIDDDPQNFHRKIHDTWIRWRNTCFSVDSVEAHINAYRDLFTSSGAYSRELTRWPDTAEPIKTEAAYIVSWYKNSFETVNDFLKDYPTEIQDIIAKQDFAVAVGTSDGRIKIDALTDEKAVVRIFTMDGTLVERIETSLPYESDVLSTGIYVVVVEIGGTSVRKKVAI